MKQFLRYLQTTIARILFRILRAFITLVVIIKLFGWYEEKSYIDKCMAEENSIDVCQESLAEMQALD